MTLEELLRPRHDEVPVRCNHCGRDADDRAADLVHEALRGRIRALEDTVRDLQAMLIGRS